jgi:hypothetical protein
VSQVRALLGEPKWLVIGRMMQDTTFKKQKELPSIVVVNERKPLIHMQQ